MGNASVLWRDFYKARNKGKGSATFRAFKQEA